MSAFFYEICDNINFFEERNRIGRNCYHNYPWHPEIEACLGWILRENVQEAARRLNNRPRKCLKGTNEIFWNKARGTSAI